MSNLIQSFDTADLLRFSTAGSVDDGKSTLIGRLLYDSKSIFEDTLNAIEKTTARRGGAGVDLALLTDGLQAEREQGITIDVAYRYFATPRRKFIIADTPGHEQYTRNMVTGASTAELAIVLIDARKGPLVQSRRHAYIATLLGIPNLVVAVNKMDLVDYSEDVFARIKAEFAPFCEQVGAKGVTFIPMSALQGDMVVGRGEQMPWYTGPTLLELLETVPVDREIETLPFRFPVQLVCRPQTPEYPDFRGYMGKVESGHLRIGDTVAVLPSGLSAEVTGIYVGLASFPEAVAGQSVTLTLSREIDISRGDMLVKPEEPAPTPAKAVDAMLCWMDNEPFNPAARYLIKQTTRQSRVKVDAVAWRVDVNSLTREPAGTIAMNDIVRVALRLPQPLLADPYTSNRHTGSFILIDELSNNTVAAGMILPQDPDAS